MLVAPAAEASQTMAATEVQCVESGIYQTPAQATDASHDDHEHHAHECGTCHFHVLRKEPANLIEKPVLATLIRVFGNVAFASRPPDPMHRPPIA